MNKKRVRETIFNLVDHWCSEEPIYRADLPWIRGQISFAYMIEAITLSEKEELVQHLHEVKGGEHGNRFRGLTGKEAEE